MKRPIQARELWHELTIGARDWAEPGCLFWDTIRRYSSSDRYPGMEVVSTNPCAEEPLEPYGDCCIGSINLAGPFPEIGQRPSSMILTTPEDSTRSAIYDRLLIREDVKDIEMGENFRRVLDRSDVRPPKVPRKEIEELWISAEGVKVSDDVKEALTELREKIRDEGVRSSTRRWFDSVRILKASAALEGRPETELQDLESLSSILWHQPEERVTARQVILGMTDPGLARVLELLDGAREELEK